MLINKNRTRPILETIASRLSRAGGKTVLEKPGIWPITDGPEDDQQEEEHEHEEEQQEHEKSKSIKMQLSKK